MSNNNSKNGFAQEPLLIHGPDGWQPNPQILGLTKARGNWLNIDSQTTHCPKKQFEYLTTEKIEEIYQIPKNYLKACKINHVLPWESHLLWHIRRNQWAVYQMKMAQG